MNAGLLRACPIAPTGCYDYSEIFPGITVNPQVMGGKPCIRGMRVTVGMILGQLAAGQSAEEILSAYPYLEPGDISASPGFTAWRVQEREVEIPA